MRRRLSYVAFALAIMVAAGVVCYAVLGRPVAIEQSEPVGRPPRIRPDYVGCVIPPNIAPLNFSIEEPGSRYCVRIYPAGGEGVELFSRGPDIKIPSGAWRKLLTENRGRQLHLDVYVQGQDGLWRSFETMTNTIADEDIDQYLVYRQIGVLYNNYVNMGICQRNLENFDETVILDNRSFGHGCINCHTFLNSRTDKVVIQMRSGRRDYGAGMVLIQDGAVAKVNTQTEFDPGLAAFASWHPSGQLLAFSINKVRQFFHRARTEVRDVVDLDSNLGIYVLDTQSVTSTRAIAHPDRLETWPAWSPDGLYLYFCSAPVLWSDRNYVPPENYEKLKYDLMRISYDLAGGRWGEPETVLSSEETGLSITQPRISPDGRFLAFCMSQYSTFPTFQPNSDLYLMDLATGRYSRMACNSDRAESWHCWSSNGRWLVFSSKRGDGLFIRAYFSYIDEDGTAHKPFVLPQEDPTFYDWYTKLYQMPELVQEPIPVRGEQIAGVIRSGPWLRSGPPVTAATPRAAAKPDAGPGRASPSPERWPSQE